MKIILHIGAHRTASTSMQAYLRYNAEKLAQSKVCVLGPHRTRHGGLLSGVVPVVSPVNRERQFMLAKGRINMQIAKFADSGIEHLIISDENMMGTVRKNLRQVSIYKDAGERLALFRDAFGGKVSRVVVSIRSQDSFWASSLAYGVARGHRLPEVDDLDRLVTQPRDWRDVITDVAGVFSDAEIQVQSYENLGGLPERKLWHMTDGAFPPPELKSREWLNKSPSLSALREVLELRGIDVSRLPLGDGRWNPFDREQTVALRETYADDLYWLRSGAGGIANLIEETHPNMAGINLPGGTTTRGHKNDEQGRMARTG